MEKKKERGGKRGIVGCVSVDSSLSDRGGEGGLLFNYSHEERTDRQEHQTLFEELLLEAGQGLPWVT